MDVDVDNDFGVMNSDGVLTRRFDIILFGGASEAEWIVQTFDGNPICEEQRSALRELSSNKQSICAAVEEAVYLYYLDNIEAFRSCFDFDEVEVKAPRVNSVSDMRGLVFLKYIKFMHPFDSVTRQVGFIFDSIFDPELGIGVLVVDGEVESVDTQDFLLG